MAWEENSRICLHMQLIAFLSRIGVINSSFEIYTNDGMKINTLQKGINIIKMADGTTRKVVIK